MVNSLVAELEAARRSSDLPRIRSIAEELESIGTPAALIESYVARAVLLANENRNAESVELYNKVLEYRKQQNDRLGIAQTSLDIGSVYNEYYVFDNALTSLHIANEIFQELNNVRGMISAQNGIGINHFYRGLLQEALVVWEPALQMALDNNEQKLISNISLCLGNAMSRTGQLPSALEYYYKSLAISEHDDTMKSSRALCFNNIGITYYYARCFADALEWWYRAMDLYVELGNEKMQGFVIENLGNLYGSNNDSARALTQYDIAIELFERLNARQPLANCYTSKSTTLLKMGDSEQAAVWREKAIDLYDSIGLATSITDLMVGTAQVYVSLGRNDEAREIIDRIKLSDIATADTILQYHDVHGQLFESSKQFNEAREVYEKQLLLSQKQGNRDGEIAAHQGLRDIAKAQGNIDLYI